MYKPTEYEKGMVIDCFEEGDIWTQEDIRIITNLNQPAVSTILSSLEKCGVVVSVGNESIRQVKFYERVN